MIANRYVSANQIHQGGKIKSPTKRREFLKWLDEMEYGVFKIPRPDATFYLDLPTAVSMRLIRERNDKSKRAYLKKKKDVHESDLEFLTNSRKSALWLADNLQNFIKIICAKGKTIRTREDIHEEIYEKVKKIIK